MLCFLSLWSCKPDGAGGLSERLVLCSSVAPSCPQPSQEGPASAPRTTELLTGPESEGPALTYQIETPMS